MSEERYREAERRLWDFVGVSPTERMVRLERLGTSVRVLEAGSGPPVLFVHGAPNGGTTWAPLAGHLEGLRCLFLDRPGTGLSDPVAVSHDQVLPFADSLIADVLDGLEVDKADLVVSSLGGYLAFRAAAAYPERIGRMVQMGSPGAVGRTSLPLFLRILGVPGVARLLGRLPASRSAGAMQLRQIGHAASLESDRIGNEFLEWYHSLQRDTGTMYEELSLISRVVTVRGFRPEVEFPLERLGGIATPTFFLWGANDAFGDEHLAQDLVEAMVDAHLEVMPDGGHLPWLDDPVRAATVVKGFLRDRQPVPSPQLSP